MIFRRFREADWRLRLYALSVPVFWFLALGPGDGGASGLEVNGEWAAFSALLLLPLWGGSKWAVTLSALYSLWLTIAIGSIGLPPWGPAFGSLALLTGIQFLLLLSYDLGPNSRSEGANGAPAVS